MDHTQADVDSLAAKLAAADLTEGEQAVMDALVDAAEGEVAGFGSGLPIGFAPLRPAEFLKLDVDRWGDPHENVTGSTQRWVENGGDTKI